MPAELVTILVTIIDFRGPVSTTALIKVNVKIIWAKWSFICWRVNESYQICLNTVEIPPSTMLARMGELADFLLLKKRKLTSLWLASKFETFSAVAKTGRRGKSFTVISLILNRFSCVYRDGIEYIPPLTENKLDWDIIWDIISWHSNIL